MLLHDVISLAAETTPDALALVDGERRWTFADLEERVCSAAASYVRLARPGDRIAVAAGNSADFVVALYAVPLAGCILVPLNTRHTPDEQAAILRSCGASVVLGDQDGLGRLRACATELSAVRRWAPLVAPDEPPAEPDPDDRPAGLDDGATAWLIHTSGTTGTPKGSMLTHRSLVAASVNTAIGRGVADDEVYLFPFPLFHVAAYNVVVHHLRRRPVVLLPRFDAGDVLRVVERESVTSVSLAPTMLAMLLDHPARSSTDLSSLRQVSYGASAMPPDLLRRTSEELPHVGVAQGYGMTELSGNAVFLGPEEHRRALAGEEHLLAAAGRPGPLAAVRIEGAEGAPASTGEVGEILVRGDQVHAGYWEDPASTAAARSGPWLRTGDLGRMDDDGYLYVVDRLKDLIITGGENVASREVEDVLCAHPDVAAVAVVGEPDDRWGERVCAVVVWRDGAPGTDDERAAELVEWSRGRLAGFKRPRAVRSVDALPVNPSGKVDKKVLRADLRSS